ncbi:MAG: hypothetical protein HYZ22_04445 [Chloroflexi bacterium]|nr:hypothetical protein [Chloroflexota bacterium]
MNPNPSPEQLDEKIAKLEEESRRIQKELAVLRSDKLVQMMLKTDGPVPRENRTVIRVHNNLTVNGTRLNLYHIMDEMQGKNSLKNVRDIYELTDEEMLDILDYMHMNKEEFEKEYQDVLKNAEEERRYWEEKNKDLLKNTYHQREATLARLREWKEKYRTENKP